jgi:hypothetical protein
MAKTSRAYKVRVRYMDSTNYNPFRDPAYDISEPVTGLMVPKMLMTDDEIIREIHLEARMLQRVQEYFKTQIEAGVKGIPNSRCLKAKELDLARRLEPIYDLDKFPNDPCPFEQDWVTKQGTFTIVRKEFTTYATQMLAAGPAKPQKSFVELTFGKEALQKEIDHFWLFGNPNPQIYDLDSLDAYNEGVKRYNEEMKLMKLMERAKTPAEAIRPFVEYKKFEEYTAHQCTKEELAEIAQRREETLGMGTPSERAGRCYLFDMIDSQPWALESLEQQAKDNEEAKNHLEWLFKQKASQATNKKDEPVSDTTDTTSINGATSEQEEMIRQMYALTVEGCEEPVFDIERSTTKHQPNCRPADETHCPMGTLVDI